MPESRGKWTDLIPATGLRIAEVYDQGDELYTPGISSLLSVTTGTGAQVNFTGKTPLGRLQQFDDGDNIPQSRRDRTYTTKVIYKNLGESIEITKNQITDRDFASELDEVKDLSRAANFSIDESGMQLFNGGFATTVRVNGYDMTWYGDAVPQFSTVHPTTVPGQSTQSNASSTGIKFGVDNLETAELALTLQQTDNGLPLAMIGKTTVVVPLALRREAQQVTMSELDSDNANNAINTYRGTHDMIASQFLDASNQGSNTAWFVMKTERSKLYHETRQSKALESDVNILNKILTTTIDARWANYSKDFRGTWGSKGDLAAYSS